MALERYSMHVGISGSDYILFPDRQVSAWGLRVVSCEASVNGPMGHHFRASTGSVEGRTILLGEVFRPREFLPVLSGIGCYLHDPSWYKSPMTGIATKLGYR